MKALSATVLLAGVVAVALSGCAPQDKGAILTSGLQAAKERCNELKAEGEITTHAEYASCLNGKEEAAYTQADYPYMDLVDDYHAERLAIADKLDRKQIDLKEAKKELTALEQRLAAEARARSGKSQAGATGDGAAAGSDEMNEIEPAAGGDAPAAKEKAETGAEAGAGGETKEYME